MCAKCRVFIIYIRIGGVYVVYMYISRQGNKIICIRVYRRLSDKHTVLRSLEASHQNLFAKKRRQKPPTLWLYLQI